MARQNASDRSRRRKVRSGIMSPLLCKAALSIAVLLLCARASSAATPDDNRPESDSHLRRANEEEDSLQKRRYRPYMGTGRLGHAAASANRDYRRSEGGEDVRLQYIARRDHLTPQQAAHQVSSPAPVQVYGQTPGPGKQYTSEATQGYSGGESSYIPNLTRDKWIGLGLAISSSLAIGTSFIITKKGLIDAADRGAGLASDGHAYLQNPIWWAGMATMIVGEVANFAAYTFAPPILVTPLGALSVLIGAVLASFILKEELGRLGRVGCTLCLVGTLIIILNAPEDREIKTVDEILNYALQPAFLLYCLTVLVFSIWMIYRIVPKYGKRTPLIYISICSSVGSISVMSVKGFGVALKLTLDGNNQFTHPSTYCFALVVIVCILVQMNYFNKALDQFSTNVVNPMYYVMFTTSTIFASFLLFKGFNTEGAAPAVSLICGFVVIFMGVYLLNINRLIDPVTQQPRMSLVTGEGVPAGRASHSRDRFLQGENGLFGPRLSMSQQRPGGYGHLPQHGRNNYDFRRGSAFSPQTDGSHSRRESGGSSVLFNAYDHEEAVGLTRLNEQSDEDELDGDEATLRGSSGGGSMNGKVSGSSRTSHEGRAKAHARSISLTLPNNLADGHIKHSPVLATASSAAMSNRGHHSASPTQGNHRLGNAAHGNGAEPRRQGSLGGAHQQTAAHGSRANLLGMEDDEE